MKIHLKGKRIFFTNTQINDIDTIIEFENKNQEFVCKYSKTKHIQLLNNEDCLHLSIFSNNKKLIGHLIVFGVLGLNKTLEFRRITINEKGQGFGREALQLLKRLCFERLKFHRLWFDVYTDNERAIHLYESEGFVKKGLLGDNTKLVSKNRSQYIYVMVSNEYTNKQKFTFPKNTLIFTGVLGFGLIGCSSEQKPPNIILFLVDDMGWTDTSVQMHTFATDNNNYQHTPNMEWLAANGMKFTNAYAASPVCSPTRTSLLTGMNPARSRITNWIAGEGQQNAERNTHLLPDWNIDGLNSSDKTLPKVLGANGYQTAHIGKAHFGRRGTEGADPLNLGFDYNIGGHFNGQPASYYSPYGKDNHPFKVHHLEDLYPDSLYLTDALTIKATELIAKMASNIEGKPFFLNMAHYAVHTPIQGDTTLIEKYKREDKNKHAQQYATMIESMDKSLGLIIEKLRELEIEDNTIILFMSDNGGLVAHTGPPTSNYPLSKGKGSSHEGGTRVPMIVRWPDVVDANSISTEAVISDDFFPTILRMANIKNWESYCEDIDGKDISPLLKQNGKFNRDGAIYWHYPHYWANLRLRNEDSTIHPYSAIRDGDWKLIYNYNNEEVELYNLANDIGESKNLLADKHQKAEELCETLRNYLISVDAQLPISRSTNEAVSYPHL